MPDFYETQKLVAPGAAGDPGASTVFGTSVALAGDGKTAVVGGPGGDGNAGAAWVFVYNGSSWAEQEALAGLRSGSDREVGAGAFGLSVALSSSGNTAVVGCPRDKGDVGSATVFVRKGTSWTNQHTFHGLTSGGDKEAGAGAFGSSVAISSNGGSVLVGTPDDHGRLGSATVFVLKGTSWVNQHTFHGLTSGGDKEVGPGSFGSAVAISADGKTVLIGAPDDREGVGTATVFVLDGTSWINQHTLFAPSSGDNREVGAGEFGSSVALSSDGSTALVGGPGDNATGIGAAATAIGAAWIFTRSGKTWDAGQKLVAPTSGSDREITDPVWGEGEFGSSVALSETGSTALVAGPNDDGVVGAVWAFDYQGAFLSEPAGWYERQKITAPTSGTGKRTDPPRFGNGVAISSDGMTALLGGPFDGSSSGGTGDAGAAWVYVMPPPPPIK